MVGRTEELELLRDALGRGRTGQPSVVLVRGEAGIGKTRLVEEFIAGIDADESPPVVVAVGQCVHLGTIGTPFLPVRRLLRALRGKVGNDAFREAVPAPRSLAALGAILPELATEEFASLPVGPGLLADAIEQLLVNLSLDRHLVLVLEDLQWADASTLDLLRSLAITDDGSHLTIICTFRLDDLHSGDPAAQFHREVSSSRSATTIELARLALTQTAELIGELSADLEPRAAARVAVRSEGVPFIVEELLGVDDRTLPSTLRDIVLARIARLSPDARDAVSALAVGGDRVDHAVFAEIEPRATAVSMREAIDARVLVATDGGYQFRHALIREAVYNEILPGERAALHKQYALTLQPRVDDGERRLATAAAEHWLRAGDLARVFDASLIAREDARASLAVTGAIELGDRLLNLWAQIPDAETRAGTTLADMTVTIMQECNAIGRHAEMISIGTRTITALGTADSVGRARVHRCLAVAYANGDRRREERLELGKARRLLEPEHGRSRDATLALVMSMELISAVADDRLRFREEIDECLELARRSCSDTEMGPVLAHTAWALADRGFLVDAARLIERAVDGSLLSGSLGARTVETHVLNLLGRFDDAAEISEQSVTLAGELGVRPGEGTLTLFLTSVASARMALGDLPRAQAALVQALADLPEDGGKPDRGRIAVIAATIDTWDGRPLDAAAVEAMTALVGGDTDDRLAVMAITAEDQLNRAENASEQEGRRATESAVRVFAPLADPSISTHAGGLRAALPAMARTAQRAAAEGLTGEHLSQLTRTLDATIADLGDDPAGVALRAVAAAEAAEVTHARDQDVADAWRAAVDAAAAGFVPVRYRLYAEYRLAVALIQAGDASEAARKLSQIIDEAPTKGAAVVGEWARAIASRLGIRVARRREAAAPDLTTGLERLTPREHEVLALVAQGLSNPEIGRKLYMSPKTASVHVSSILVKLGASNRTEVATMYATALAHGG
jgi:DNA-binding NarL/FixJ family response regulator